MRLLHTADWHLNDRLGRIDRTDDLRRAVERIAGLCESERVDVLLVAGDLFSELARPDALRETIRHWQATFGPFLARGGTILAVTGNHDQETFCQTLRHAMALAAPLTGQAGESVPPGRLYLATQPTLITLNGVSFALMPWPTVAQYPEAAATAATPQDRIQRLTAAFQKTVESLPILQGKPAVLVAHVHALEAPEALGFRIARDDQISLAVQDWATRFDYVALGHIHKPMAILGHDHVRYSGSIERMDLGEQFDEKSIVLVDLNENGLASAPRLIPIPSCRIRPVIVSEPAVDIPRMRELDSDPSPDLVTLQIRYASGVDDLDTVLRELDVLFPRWYAREWKEVSTLGPSLVAGEADASKGFAEVVREYLAQELAHHDDAEQAAILAALDEFLAEGAA